MSNATTQPSDFKDMPQRVMDEQDLARKKLYKQIQEQDEIVNRKNREMTIRKRILTRKVDIDNMYQQIEKEDDEFEETPVDGDIKAGTAIFTQNCSSCHSMEPLTKGSMKAPTLGLIFNRRAGADKSYSKYQIPLLTSNFYWNARNLNRFMQNTSLLLATTNCGLMKNPMKSESDRADLLALFKEYSQQLEMNIKIKQINTHGYDYYQMNVHSNLEVRKMGENIKEQHKAQSARP